MPSRFGTVLFAACLLAACHKPHDGGVGPEGAGTAQIIPKPPSPAPVQDPEPGLRLPASFRGTLTCKDCRGIDTQLELRNDHSYLLEERYIGAADASTRRTYTLGHFVEANGTLRLEAQGEPSRYWKILGPARLQALGAGGRPKKAGQAILTLSDQPLLSGSHLLLRGHYVFIDDVGFFRECETNHSWPVATAGDSDALAQAYADFNSDGNAVVFAKVEAHLVHQPDITGKHSEESLVIDHVLALNRGENCKT